MVESNPSAAQDMSLRASSDSRTAAIAQVASAYASKDSSTVAEILALVDGLSRAFYTAETGAKAQSVSLNGKSITAPASSNAPVPAVPIDQAVQDDKVTCLICGGSYTMLKRHLKAEHGVTEEEYRAMFNLPEDMPLVAPAYSARKAEYARKSGLGKHSRDPQARNDN